MTALAFANMVARIYSRGWMTHSTGSDDYTMWVAAVGEERSSNILVTYCRRRCLL
jgi:hypothetical protein